MLSMSRDEVVASLHSTYALLSYSLSAHADDLLQSLSSEKAARKTVELALEAEKQRGARVEILLAEVCRFGVNRYCSIM
jgi:hypothetical protein